MLVYMDCHPVAEAQQGYHTPPIDATFKQTGEEKGQLQLEIFGSLLLQERHYTDALITATSISFMLMVLKGRRTAA